VGLCVSCLLAGAVCNTRPGVGALRMHCHSMCTPPSLPLPCCLSAAYRLLPMGSHPRVADKRGTYDLFGPVNKLWGGGYDKAMSVFLACLKEFGDFARARWVLCYAVLCCTA
jgi:hypothetical protein